MMNTIFRLLCVGMIPVAVSVVLFLLQKNKSFDKTSYMLKQVFFGVVFGGLAVLATEYGVPAQGATLNARDAAPLCAALIFGAPAGIIAGLIGGLERWFAVYWGAGMYTRMACTLSTIITGFFGAVLKKLMFDDEIPGAGHAYFVGLVAEVMHMMMIFITNMDDSKHAFDVVKICTVPMVTVVALAVFLAVFLVNLIKAKGKIFERKKDYTVLSQLFQKNMLLIVVVAFLVTNAFTYVLQHRIAERNTSDLMSISINDADAAITSASDKNLLNLARLVANRLETFPTLTNEILLSTAEAFDVTEINVIDTSNIIVYSTNPEYLGFDMLSGDQSADFTRLNNGTFEYVQPFQKISYDNTTTKKYAGRVLEKGGYVQVAYDTAHFKSDIASEVSSVALNRHVGEYGKMIVADGSLNIISSDRFSRKSLKEVIPDLDFNSLEEMKVYRATVGGTDCFVMYGNTEGFIILAYIPVEQAVVSRDLSIYLTSFMEIIIFAALFILTYFLVKYLVVNNIIKVDKSLSEITEGKLDTVVDVRASREFVSLSDGINHTVDTLKDYIDEANARIDAELKVAAEIQRSALPSVFPPFPERDEFDIYALMHPAKEVGGDFYDFYIINNDTLVFTVADVSGKGIPASLFMMKSKTLIKNYAEGGLQVNDIFTNANYNLCDGNDAGMFVTAWIGFLNLNTGELAFANAGHNPPLIKRKDGTYEYLKSKAGFVLGGMEGIVYKKQETYLAPGDEIFLYTDGVPEATNANNELFGEDRLKDTLDRHCKLDVESLCNALHKDIDSFVGEAPQFDDITMMSIRLHKLHQ